MSTLSGEDFAQVRFERAPKTEESIIAYAIRMIAERDWWKLDDPIFPGGYVPFPSPLEPRFEIGSEAAFDDFTDTDLDEAWGPFPWRGWWYSRMLGQELAPDGETVVAQAWEEMNIHLTRGELETGPVVQSIDYRIRAFRRYEDGGYLSVMTNHDNPRIPCYPDSPRLEIVHRTPDGDNFRVRKLERVPNSNGHVSTLVHEWTENPEGKSIAYVRFPEFEEGDRMLLDSLYEEPFFNPPADFREWVGREVELVETDVFEKGLYWFRANEQSQAARRAATEEARAQAVAA